MTKKHWMYLAVFAGGAIAGYLILGPWLVKKKVLPVRAAASIAVGSGPTETQQVSTSGSIPRNSTGGVQPV